MKQGMDPLEHDMIGKAYFVRLLREHIRMRFHHIKLSRGELPNLATGTYKTPKRNYLEKCCKVLDLSYLLEKCYCLLDKAIMLR